MHITSKVACATVHIRAIDDVGENSGMNSYFTGTCDKCNNIINGFRAMNFQIDRPNLNHWTSQALGVDVTKPPPTESLIPFLGRHCGRASPSGIAWSKVTFEIRFTC